MLSEPTRSRIEGVRIIAQAIASVLALVMAIYGYYANDRTTRAAYRETTRAIQSIDADRLAQQKQLEAVIDALPSIPLEESTCMEPIAPPAALNEFPAGDPVRPKVPIARPTGLSPRMPRREPMKPMEPMRSVDDL